MYVSSGHTCMTSHLVISHTRPDHYSSSSEAFNFIKSASMLSDSSICSDGAVHRSLQFHRNLLLRLPFPIRPWSVLDLYTCLCLRVCFFVFMPLFYMSMSCAFLLTPPFRLTASLPDIRLPVRPSDIQAASLLLLPAYLPRCLYFCLLCLPISTSFIAS